MGKHVKQTTAFLGAIGVVAVIAVAVLSSSGASPAKQLSQQDAQGIKRAVETYLKVMETATVWPVEYRHLESLPDSVKKNRYDEVFKSLSEVSTQGFVEDQVGIVNMLSSMEKNGGRTLSGDVKIVSWENIVAEDSDTAIAIAIVWVGNEKGEFNSTKGAIEPVFKVDNTTVRRFHLQKVSGKWKVMGIPEYVKGLPLDDGDPYGPPTAEEANKTFDRISPKTPGKPKLWPEK